MRLLIFLALLGLSTAVTPAFLRMRMRRLIGEELDTPFPGTKANITQKIDNFSNSNATYQQRYWYNPLYTKNNSIAFLLIQGEGIATDNWATNQYTYIRLAELYGADVFMLEHRCFGYSRPYPDMTVEHLQVCNVKQALADTHNFIQYMNAKMNYQNPRWITFGGSYPGALSALFRQQYPLDTVGAVASSAPMLWTLDFFQYAQVVQDTFTKVKPACADAVNQAFAQMQQLSLSNEGRDQLNKYFNLQPPFAHDATTQLDVDNFFANVYSIFQDTTQYTGDGRNTATMGGLGVPQLCAIMTDTTVSDVITRVNNVIQWYNNMTGMPSATFANSYSDMMTVLSNVTYDDEHPYLDNSAFRGWMWLCCNQLGVLQTTDQGRNIFQQTVPLNYFIDQCTQMFNDSSVNIKTIRDNNQNFLKQYGGTKGYLATNVVLPNGEYDPWHALGMATNTTSTMTPILIKEAAHCSDMYPPYAGESTDLNRARTIINQQVASFLNVPYVPLPAS